jgi:outer membrane lipoprotein
MTAFKNVKQLAMLVMLTSLSACTIVPEQIDVAQETKLIPFDLVNASAISVGPSLDDEQQSQASSSLVGGKARWGGKIVSVVNKKDVSEVEVVFFPENRFGKPLTSMASSGRFKAIVEGFVDPLVFEQSRLITVVGMVSDSQKGIIGEQEYLYPTLNAKGYYLWKESTDVRVEIDSFAFSPFGYRSSFNHSFFNPWYDPWLLNRQRGRVKVYRYNGHSQGGSVINNQPSSVTNMPTQKQSVDRIRSNRQPEQQK